MKSLARNSPQETTYAGRKGVKFENEKSVLFVQNIGGMTPVFALKQNKDLINSTWLPHFRGAPGKKFSYENPADVDYWGHKLLFEACGTFCCCPNFGSGENIAPDVAPPHGHTANLEWNLTATGATELNQYAQWKMTSPSPWQLSYTKYDLLSKENPTHTVLLEVENTGDTEQPINLAWHTTLGEPLLCDGGLLSCSSDQFATAPLGCEFDTTGNFHRDSTFKSLTEIPLLNGNNMDGSIYRLHTGFSDLVTAQMPANNDIGWASFINPHLNLGYLTLSPTPTMDYMHKASFCNFWMQQGGRLFAPWADEKDAPDRTKALGMEMGIGYFANGLSESISHPELLSRPTYVMLQPGEKVRYSVINLMFQPEFKGEVTDITKVNQGISVGTHTKKQTLNCDVILSDLTKIIASIR